MDTMAVFLGFIIGALIFSILILMLKPRETDDPIGIVKNAVNILERNHWSLLVRPVDGKNVFGLITDRWKKEHSISGRMRDRGHIISLTGDEEWEEWLDYYNSLTGNIDELVAADGTAVMTMAMTRNLDDNIRDIKWFIPRPQAEYLKRRADYSDALEGRVHTAERDLEGVDNLRVKFHRDRKQLRQDVRTLNTENDMLLKQISELKRTKKLIELEVLELRGWRALGGGYLNAENKGAGDAGKSLAASYYRTDSQLRMKEAELQDALNTKMPPNSAQKTMEGEAHQTRRTAEETEKTQQLEKKEGG